jgi:hypothetical protein
VAPQEDFYLLSQQTQGQEFFLVSATAADGTLKPPRRNGSKKYNKERNDRDEQDPVQNLPERKRDADRMV